MSEFKKEYLKIIDEAKPIVEIAKHDLNNFRQHDNRKLIKESIIAAQKVINDQKRKAYIAEIRTVGLGLPKSQHSAFKKIVNELSEHLEKVLASLVKAEGIMTLLPNNDSNLPADNLAFKSYEELEEQINQFNEYHETLLETIRNSLPTKIQLKEKPNSNDGDELVTLANLQEITARVVQKYKSKMDDRGKRHKPTIMHSHGKKGLAAAKKFQSELDTAKTVPEYIDKVNKYIQDKKSPGNFYPGSFKSRMARAFNNTAWMQPDGRKTDHIRREHKEKDIKKILKLHSDDFLKNNYQNYSHGAAAIRKL